MLIWNGKGYLVAVIVFACSLIGELITRQLYESDRYYSTQIGPLAIVFLTAGIMTTIVSNYIIRKAEEKAFVDENTGLETYIRANDTFFFIPIRFWGAILIVLSLIMFLFN